MIILLFLFPEIHVMRYYIGSATSPMGSTCGEIFAALIDGNRKNAALIAIDGKLAPADVLLFWNAICF